MGKEKLKDLKKEYLETPIPDNLDDIISKAVKGGRSYNMKKKLFIKRTSVVAASVAVMMVVITAGVNTSQVFASDLSKVPILGSLVEVLTFREYDVKEENYEAHISVPSIHGLEDKGLEDKLNEKYILENKRLYEEFIEEVEELKEDNNGKLSVESGYVVKTDTDRILSVARYTESIEASSDLKVKYDTIDKIDETLITLPSLFKDDSYIEVISNNIKEQMQEKMKENVEEVFWYVGDGIEESPELFDEISAKQTFYINDQGKLVIVFDKYVVAPGYMGVQEFIIPTNIISDILISNEYIKL